MKISTGIKGLDVMLKGGLIRDRVYLVKGGPGTGKTILSLQFLIEGAKNGEKVVYMSLEETIEEIYEDAKSLNLDLSGIETIDASPSSSKSIFGDSYFMDLKVDLGTFLSILEDIIKVQKPSRLVIDPITMLRVATKDESEYRRDFLALVGLLRKYQITTIFVAEVSDVEDYLVSGVIELLSLGVGNKFIRGIRIVKMRGTDFDENIRPYKIKEGGVEVYPEVEVLG